ncbi:MAG: Lrp/AsnC family transcriptional regulator [Candidatus Bilamarchaeaceae archaeon]
MDPKDEEIVLAMMQDSRQPLRGIAERLGVSETAVRKRLKRLEGDGTIRAYSAVVDPASAGFFGTALVGIDTDKEKLLDVLELVKGLPQVRYAALTTGDHNIIFEIWCRKESELNSVLKKLKKTEGVKKTCPALFIKRVE